MAGATGAVGRPLVSQLVATDFEVFGLTRSASRADALRAAGAEAVICDVLDGPALSDAVHAVKPDIIIDQLSSLSPDYNARKLAKIYAPNNRVRHVGTAALVAAAKEVGVRRYILQSIAFLYEPDGRGIKSEDDAPYIGAPAPFGEVVRIVVHNERLVTQAGEFDGLALRYGLFYGPGTWFASDGSIAKQTRQRQFPVGGGGEGVASFVHVHDAAAAAVRAASGGRPGIYNIVDDDPTPMREWLPKYAERIGAKPPRRVPAWLVRLAANDFLAKSATRACGADNARAKAELAWQPGIASWREGFERYLDQSPV
ncbi:MAG: NAD(P)-dependent oxidoreductase [Solirubrobacterales bacterium]